jgi:hypothetical protein
MREIRFVFDGGSLTLEKVSYPPFEETSYRVVVWDEGGYIRSVREGSRKQLKNSVRTDFPSLRIHKSLFDQLEIRKVEFSIEVLENSG